MVTDIPVFNRRILVVDDSQSIHGDYLKILGPRASSDAAMAEVEAALFDEVVSPILPAPFQIDFAFQGEEALAKVQQSLADKLPYAMAFMDVRMPPGWDGIETAARIWEQDPELQIVICTAYSDHSWEQIRERLGHSDRFVILKKPFDNIEVQQLAEMLTEKWLLSYQAKHRFADLERIIHQRTHELQRKGHMEDDAAPLSATTEQEQQALNTQVRRRLVMEGELRQALERGELSVHYQPLIEIATQRIVSLEALVRWQHPTDGAISPAAFIPMAEESGLIVPLGEFVLRTVCQQIVRWDREGLAVVPVAVNVSAVQLQRLDIWQMVRGILSETGLKPRMLELEITESSIIKDAKNHIHQLQGLRRDGVRILIDDFGTGYSSLSYLKQLPIDALKIDRSFISQIATNSVDAAIVCAILGMARSLGLHVIAEGVETAAQFEVLRTQGCDIAQGFLFSRPLPADDCRQLLLDNANRFSLQQPAAMTG